MAVPAPAIPSGNAYTVHVARPPAATAPESSPLTTFAAAAARLLATWKIPVRMHVAGADTTAMDLRAFLAANGARASAFSPAPFPDRPGIPGEGFWKTSLAVVDAEGGTDGKDDFRAAERPERKVEWDPLLAALTAEEPPRASGPALRRADLWIAHQTAAAPDEAALRAAADAWRAAGAGAIVVLGPSGAAWSSGNAVFGRSAGYAAIGPEVRPQPGTRHGLFAAGIVAGLVHDLLAENLFDKTLLRVERECLAMRPLRLGRAVESGAAACLAAAETDIFELLRRPGAFAARHRDLLRARRGPEPQPWPHKGR